MSDWKPEGVALCSHYPAFHAAGSPTTRIELSVRVHAASRKRFSTPHTAMVRAGAFLRARSHAQAR
jgi:hypothetical protein